MYIIIIVICRKQSDLYTCRFHSPIHFPLPNRWDNASYMLQARMLKHKVALVIYKYDIMWLQNPLK